MSYPAYFHTDSGCVRFSVLVAGQPIGASISRATLHHRYRPQSQDEDPLNTYLSHAADIDAAVCRRVAAGSIEPVMLREFDVRVQPA